MMNLLTCVYDESNDMFPKNRNDELQKNGGKSFWTSVKKARPLDSHNRAIDSTKIYSKEAASVEDSSAEKPEDSGHLSSLAHPPEIFWVSMLIQPMLQDIRSLYATSKVFWGACLCGFLPNLHTHGAKSRQCHVGQGFNSCPSHR